MGRHDVIIVGGGPAGMSAALWARRLGLDHAACDAGTAPGGQLQRVYDRIVDYPGVETADGAELAAVLDAQLARHEVTVRRGAIVRAVEPGAVVLDGERLEARFIVQATGIRRRRLGVPGEADEVGRGLAPSAARYASRFAGMHALVVGGGDAAFDEALLLAPACEHVTIAHRSDRFTARREFREAVEKDPRIDIRPHHTVEAIESDRVRLRSPDGPVVLPIGAVFVCVGVEPASDLVRGLVDLDERGYVRIDARARTSVEGIYAIGDVTSGSSWTVAAAVGQAAAALKDIQRRMR